MPVKVEIKISCCLGEHLPGSVNNMPERRTTITNKLGLHARAAAKFVQVAAGFSSEVNVGYQGKEVSGKSITGMMMLAAGQGAEIRVAAYGSDANQALAALEALILERFGEAE